MSHDCPPRCHLCPDMDGDVMPYCMGTAAGASDPGDTSKCTCNERGTIEVTYLEKLEQAAAAVPNGEEFRRLVADMRSTQREYFRTRSATALEYARRLERQVDLALRNAGQQKLKWEGDE